KRDWSSDVCSSDLTDQAQGELEPGGLELLPAVERQTQEAHHLVHPDARAQRVSVPRPGATLGRVRVEEPRAKSLRGLPSVRRGGNPRFARAHPEVGEELAQV